MDRREKQYILQNAGKKTLREIASELGIKERKVKKFLHENRLKSPAERSQPLHPSDHPQRHQIPAFAAAAIIAAIALTVYANSFSNAFVYDDESHIVDNTAIRDPSNIPKMFVHDLTYFSEDRNGKFYRPLESVSFAVDYLIWGLKPFGYHLTNTLLHLSVALLLYFFACFIVIDNVQALMISIIYLIHPVHTEAVTYISGRADSLSAVFLLAMAICQYRWWSSGRNARAIYYTAMLILFAGALLTKELAALFPFLLMIFEYCFRQKDRYSGIINKRALFYIPFFIMIAIWYFARSAIVPLSAGVLIVPPLSARLIIIPRVIFDYLRLSFIPMNLHMDYQLPYPNSLFQQGYFEPLLPAAIFASIVAFLWVKGRSDAKCRTVFFGLAWFAIALFPYLNIAFPLNAPFAEHWLYIPEMGLVISVVAAVFMLASSMRIRRALVIFLAIIAVVFACLTIRQNTVWKDGMSFYSHTLKHAPYSARIYNNLAIEFKRRGDFAKARELLECALKIDPDYTQAKENLQDILTERE